MNVEVVRKALKNNKTRLLRKKGIVGIGVGRTVKGGVRSDENCISVLVEKKIPLENLPIGDVIPRSVDGVRVDVVEVGKVKALRTSKVRPAPGGVSIGHFQITAGTLGCYVKDSAGQVFVLSNNHVMANSNNAEVGDPIYQPGPHDGGSSVDTLARLVAWKEISFGGGGGSSWLDLIKSLLCALFGVFCETGEPNFIDAAIASVGSQDVDLNILEVGVPQGSAIIAVGEQVKKSGRTSGFTTGEVLQTDVTIQVEYGAGQIATFEEQIVSDIGSAGGDSGSVILNTHNEVVGLLFAGSDTITVFNPIQPVLAEFGVEIA